MSTPSKDTANASSNSNKTAEVTAAVNNFIADANAAIANAEGQGKFTVFLNVVPPADMVQIMQHFTDLGYSFSVIAPSNGQNTLLGGLPFGPAELFGQLWINFWTSPQGMFAPGHTFQVKIDWS